MAALRIVYDGTSLSGKHRSLHSVLRHSGIDSEYRKLRSGQEYELGPQFEHQGRVLLSCSSARSFKIYDDPRDPALGDRVLREAEELAAADGIIFVLDSQQVRDQPNLLAYDALTRDTALLGSDIREKAMVFQVNKRDLPGIRPVEWYESNFSTDRCAFVESTATEDIGTVEALETVLALLHV